MKLRKNEHYFNIAAYTVISCLIVLVGVFVLIHYKVVWDEMRAAIRLIWILVEPLLIGFILAYLLDPIVVFYEKRWDVVTHQKKFHLPWFYHKKVEKRRHVRTVPTLFTFITVIAVLGLLALIVQMNIRKVAGSFSIGELKESLDSYVNYFEEMIQGITQFTEQMGIVRGQGFVERLYSEVNRFVVYLYNDLAGRLLDLGIHAMNVLLAVVIAFYLLQDKNLFIKESKRFLRHILKEKRYRTWLQLGQDINHILAGYIRGEIIDSIIIMILTSGTLLIIQLDFAIIIGIISGIFNLIPYFGPIVGFVLAVVIGLLDGNPIKAFYAAIAILIIQQIDGWFIVPKIVGDCVKLHPVAVLLAILIGGNLFGLLGMLLAVPVAAFIRLLLIKFMEKKEKV